MASRTRCFWKTNRPLPAKSCAGGGDFAVAWDGDFDRCFLFDHRGGFIAGEHVVGLLAEAHLAKEPGATIVHDPRVIWNTQAVIARGGGTGIMAPTGHVFLKAAMRASGAVYGGEMSAHHYFRDFMACDSGMIPWLLVAELVSRRGQPLADLVAEYRARFPSSGEINFRVADAKAALTVLHDRLVAQAQSVDWTDGLSMVFGHLRVNLRASNTEALLRLNVESQGDLAGVNAMVARMRDLIERLPKP